jgi:hypothetical protein
MCAATYVGKYTKLPLPEDYLMRGLILTHNYFPTKWFER